MTVDNDTKPNSIFSGTSTAAPEQSGASAADVVNRPTQTTTAVAAPATSPVAAPTATAPVQAPEVVEEEESHPVPDEKEIKKALMQRATLMGISFSNNSTVESLRAKINAALDGAPEKADEPEVVEEPVVEAVASNEVNALTGESENKPQKTFREQQHDEQLRMIRIRVTCMDPKKKDLKGEIFTIANEYIGTVRKFVPFGEDSEGGYHVPYCILTMMEDRKFLNIRIVKNRLSGRDEVLSSWAKEFAIEILPPLTQQELNQLATAQIAAGSLDSDLQ